MIPGRASTFRLGTMSKDLLPNDYQTVLNFSIDTYHDELIYLDCYTRFKFKYLGRCLVPSQQRESGRCDLRLLLRVSQWLPVTLDAWDNICGNHHLKTSPNIWTISRQSIRICSDILPISLQYEISAFCRNYRWLSLT